MWIVKLVKKPRGQIWGDGYFPRKTRYKKDAQKIVENVKHHGGEANIERV